MSKKKKERDTSKHNGQDPVEETTIDAQADSSSENELAELKDKYLRLFAEFDNYKKRTARERLDLIRTAAEDLVIKLLPVLFQWAILYSRRWPYEMVDNLFVPRVTQPIMGTRLWSI